MKIFVVIVTYNPKNWIDKCLTSLRQNSMPVSVVIIDNASIDNSSSYIVNKYPEVKFIQSKLNLGFGKANNLGIKTALEFGAEYIFLLNQDAYVEVNTIHELHRLSNRFPEYGILSPLHLSGNMNALDYKFSNCLNPINCPDYISDITLSKNIRQIYDCKFVNAAAWFMPASIFKIVGGFDPLFYHYGEDDNYCQRVLFHGFKIGITPTCRIIHDRLQTVNNYNSHKIESLSYFIRKKLIMLADINICNSEKEFKEAISGIRFKLLISAIKYRKLDFKINLLRLKKLKSLKSHIFKSIVINRNKGMHYINDL